LTAGTNEANQVLLMVMYKREALFAAVRVLMDTRLLDIISQQS
jgi:hypothetical protein